MSDLVLLAATLVFSLVAALSPSSGLLAYVGYAVLNPQSYTWFYSRDFPHSKLLAVSMILGYLASSETRRFPRQRESLLMLVMWGMFGVSTLFALSPERAWVEFMNASKILLMFFFTTALICTDDRIRSLVKIIALGLGLYGVKIGIFVLSTGGQSAITGPANTYLAANNSIGMALAMNVPLLFYISKTEPRKWLRWCMRVMMAASYPAVAGTFARGDWIGLAVITALMLLKSRRKFLTLSAAGIFAIVALAWIPEMVSPAMSNRYEMLVNYEEDDSAESRFWNWEFCRRVGVASPLTGAGFKLFSREAYATYYPEFLDRWPGKVWSCHNTFLLVLAEHGAVALVLWIGLLISCFISLRGIRLFGMNQGELWLTDYADMLQLALIGFIIMGMFVDFAYYEIFYQLVAVIVVIKERIAQTVIQTAPVPVVFGLNRASIRT
jgi:putative inorganic carbon (HCO3(-)) transporter